MGKIIQDIDVLRQKSEPVASVKEATELISQLKDILLGMDNGIGLAAIQIGIPKQVGVIKEEDHDPVIIINPEVIEKEDEFVFLSEGCLSFPGIFRDTKRYRQVTIKNHVIDGDKFREEIQVFYYPDKDSEQYVRSSSVLTCVALQHELEHFEGKLILDHDIKSMPIIKAVPKVGRNEKCPCGSGLKYKKCCGK